MEADLRLCSAVSSQSGEPCRKPPIRGATVCASHGGSAPQVREAAKRRLLEAVDPALARLCDLVHSPDERVALQAIRLVLDRAGIIVEPEVVITAEMIEGEIARLEAQLSLPPHPSGRLGR